MSTEQFNETGRRRRRDGLPRSLPWRGMAREEAAAYVGVSTTLFDEMVADGRMPGPKLINSRTIWDVKKLDIAFDALPTREDRNSWDD